MDYICPICGEGITTVLHYTRTINEIKDECNIDDEDIISEDEKMPYTEESFECPECESDFERSSWHELRDYLTNN